MLLVGMQVDTATTENSMKVLEKTTNRYLNEWILQNPKEMYQTSISAVLNKS